MIKIDISTSAGEIARGLREFPKEMASAIVSAMDTQNAFTVGHIQRKKLTTRGPNSVGVNTGTLRGSVYATQASATSTTIESEIGTPVFYALFQELGTKSYTIVPKTARVLSWVGGDGTRRFAKKVKHPGLQARRMFQTGIEERSEDYRNALVEAVESAWDSV